MLNNRQPVLRRFWYPVMPVAQVDQGPQPFTLLGEKIVLWKDADGRYAATIDRCPHRSAALSKGWVDGNALVCPYHGWSFDRAGACVRVPQRPDSNGLKGTAVQSFACEVRRSASRWRRFPTGRRKRTPVTAASTSSTSAGTAPGYG